MGTKTIVAASIAAVVAVVVVVVGLVLDTLFEGMKQVVVDTDLAAAAGDVGNGFVGLVVNVGYATEVVIIEEELNWKQKQHQRYLKLKDAY
ncbi:unnamed protein product [Ambrosiozyma monospora]|uniref:Unnamed protein product n=1 Tax=Ambrosiozyma monospora TaxID=43982 RepID=A0A9W6Z2W5_AMBMO|nr:unnamed protein product [Ambrosiozyma monospora]